MSRRKSGLIRNVAIALIFLSSQALAADLSGVWWIDDRSETAKVDHVALPFLPEGADQHKLNREAIAAGKVVPLGDPPCMPPGLPRMMLSPYPMQILQLPWLVTILHERMHQARLIYIDRDHRADADFKYRGDSIGKWDGDALVVDTTSLHGNTLIDKTGIPHSDALRVTERFSLKNGGKTLEDRITVEDPRTFTRPWSFTVTYTKRADVRLLEDACLSGPPQRDRVARK
jgi:hypothetical protein